MDPTLGYKLLTGVIAKLTVSKAWVSEKETLNAV